MPAGTSNMMTQRSFVAIAFVGFVLSVSARSALAQKGGSIPIPSIQSLDDLAGLSPAQLDALYASGTASALPSGKIEGRAIQFPGTSIAVPASKAARVVWQGKVIDASGTRAVNRFFGVKMIHAKIYQGQSWRDGGPALILDYQNSSLVYARNRDEIREVAPGLFLGLMYARTSPTPTLKMYFALDGRR
jgi:hypothetical protein